MIGTLLAASAREQMFSIIRKEAISVSGEYCTVMLLVASFLCAFVLLRLAYNIASDEQHGGWGGVTLYEIVRPFVILMLVGSSSLFIGMIDDLAGVVTAAIDESIPVEQEDERFEELYRKDKTAYLNEVYGGSQESWPELSDAVGKMKKGEVLSGLKDGLKAVVGVFSFDVPMMGNWKMWGSALCRWLFKMLAIIYQYLTEIYLCIYALLCPVSLALSIVNVWKDNIISFIARYLQLSLWKVIIECFVWIVTTARMGVMAIGDAVGGGLAGPLNYDPCMLVLMMLSIAGMFAIRHTPDIAAGIIHAAVSGSAASGASGAAMDIYNIPGKAASGAVKAGKIVAGL